MYSGRGPRFVRRRRLWPVSSQRQDETPPSLRTYHTPPPPPYGTTTPMTTTTMMLAEYSLPPLCTYPCQGIFRFILPTLQYALVVSHNTHYHGIYYNYSRLLYSTVEFRIIILDSERSDERFGSHK